MEASVAVRNQSKKVFSTITLLAISSCLERDSRVAQQAFATEAATRSMLDHFFRLLVFR